LGVCWEERRKRRAGEGKEGGKLFFFIDAKPKKSRKVSEEEDDDDEDDDDDEALCDFRDLKDETKKDEVKLAIEKEFPVADYLDFTTDIKPHRERLAKLKKLLNDMQASWPRRFNVNKFLSKHWGNRRRDFFERQRASRQQHTTTTMSVSPPPPTAPSSVPAPTVAAHRHAKSTSSAPASSTHATPPSRSTPPSSSGTSNGSSSSDSSNGSGSGSLKGMTAPKTKIVSTPAKKLQAAAGTTTPASPTVLPHGSLSAALTTSDEERVTRFLELLGFERELDSDEEVQALEIAHGKSIEDLQTLRSHMDFRTLLLRILKAKKQEW